MTDQHHTKSLAEAAIVSITPKAFEMSSKYLWLAMEAAIREWGWPEDLTPEESLDYYLLEGMKRSGFLLASHVVLPPNAENTANETED